MEETRALRSRIHLAEMAQRQASGVEKDYEEVIRLLEAEITELKSRDCEPSAGQTKVSPLPWRLQERSCDLSL